MTRNSPFVRALRVVNPHVHLTVEANQLADSERSKMANKEWAKAEAYWREHHAKQPYADKNLSYDDYVSAYRIGHEAALKYSGKEFEEVEDEIAWNFAKAPRDRPPPG